MRSRLCLCCGQVMENGVSLSNPNLCASCGEANWADESQADAMALTPLSLSHVPVNLKPAPALPSFTEIPSEMQQLIEMDEPSVIECLEAELAAKRAIAEMAYREVKAIEQKLSTVARRIHQT